MKGDEAETEEEAEARNGGDLATRKDQNQKRDDPDLAIVNLDLEIADRNLKKDAVNPGIVERDATANAEAAAKNAGGHPLNENRLLHLQSNCLSPKRRVLQLDLVIIEALHLWKNLALKNATLELFLSCNYRREFVLGI